jgi:hypothetical protein
MSTYKESNLKVLLLQRKLANLQWHWQKHTCCTIGNYEGARYPCDMTNNHGKNLQNFQETFVIIEVYLN